MSDFLRTTDTFRPVAARILSLLRKKSEHGVVELAATAEERGR